MPHKVKCIHCGQIFDRDKEPFVQVSPRRYAHKNCSLSNEERQTQLIKDQEDLNNYIKKLFDTTYVSPRVQKQINSYVNEYNYTYSGIMKALIYFYEVKGNSIEKSNGGIGIVPYVYKDAFNYYYMLWSAQQKNEHKVIKEYVPVVKEIVIPTPKPRIKKRNLFAFLDEEEEN